MSLVFLDTETLGLGLDDPIWEFAAIRREDDGTETRYHWHLTDGAGRSPEPPDDFPESFLSDFHNRYGGQALLTPGLARYHLERHVFREDRPHVVGAVPNFDTERIAHQLGASGWHYHLIDIENLAVGWLAGRGLPLPPLPWDSNDLSRAVGVDPDDYRRHEAMADVEWARAIYDRLINDGSPS